MVWYSNYMYSNIIYEHTRALNQYYAYKTAYYALSTALKSNLLLLKL